MGRADYFQPHAWNFICDQCGAKYKSMYMRLSTASGGGPPSLRVCPQCWDHRNPQEFVRGVADPHAIPWSRPRPPYLFGSTSTMSGVRSMDSFTMDSTSMG